MLEKYKFVQQIGQGSYGTVDLVEDDKGQMFALKTTEIDPFLEEDSSNEFSTLSLLSHPNFVRAVDFECEENICHLLMEYCDQGNLREYY